MYLFSQGQVKPPLRGSHGRHRNLTPGLGPNEHAMRKPEENIAYLGKLWQSYGSQAEVWVLPEMWSTGFSVSERAVEDEPGPAHQAMRTWAQSYKALFVGSLKVRTPTGHLYNRAYVVSPTGEWAHYNKRHLFCIAGEERGGAAHHALQRPAYGGADL